jgi:hypothetical protein
MLECGEQWALSPAVKRIMRHLFLVWLADLQSTTSLSFLRIAKKPRKTASSGTATLPTLRTATAAWLSVMRRQRESLLSYAGVIVCAAMESTMSLHASRAHAFLVRSRSCLGRRVVMFAPAASGKKQRHPSAAPSAR